jgi:uncharacterized protein (DUF1501 family)
MKNHENCRCNRRSFLKGSGLMLAGASLTTYLPAELVNMAMASTTGKRILFWNLFGGCDVMNTVIPHGDPDYNATNRPTLFIAPPSADPNSGINLNGFASLHPAMSKLMPLFNSGDLAIVHRLGYQSMSLSHFDGYKIWNGGDPAHKSIADGWLYRYIETQGLSDTAALPVLTINGATPGLVNGAERFVNIANVDNFDYLQPDPNPRQKFRQYWRQVFSANQGLDPFKPVLSQTGVRLLDVTEQFRLWDHTNWNPKDPNTGQYLFPVSAATDSPGFGINAWGFFKNLKVAALSLLESDGRGNGTRIAGLEMGGFDTHDTQGTLTGAHPDLLRWIAYGMNSLYIVFRAAETYDSGTARSYPAIWDDLVIVTWSEFGRTSRENGSVGTDHGQATFSLVAGGGVNGGVYNCDASTWEPGAMFAIDGHYLSHRSDFRALFWETLRDHMGASPSAADTVFPGYSSAGLSELNLFTV